MYTPAIRCSCSDLTKGYETHIVTSRAAVDPATNEFDRLYRRFHKVVSMNVSMSHHRNDQRRRHTKGD